MPYIGRDLRTGAFRQLDDISSGFDGSDTTHTMQVNSTNVSVGDVNQILLSLGGVIQKPGTDFTVSGSTLTFTTAPAANTSFFAILLGSDNGGTVTPTDASVTVSKLAIAGGEVKLDADGDTSITADTDDQIDFKAGGTDIMSLTATTATFNDGVTISVADNSDTLTLKSTDDDTAEGPVLKLTRDPSGVAAGDNLGAIKFVGDDDAGNATEYFEIQGSAESVGNGTEDGRVTFALINNGTARNVFDMTSLNIVFNQDSQDIDFRVESDTQTHAIYLVGSSSRLGVNNSSPGRTLHIINPVEDVYGLGVDMTVASGNPYGSNIRFTDQSPDNRTSTFLVTNDGTTSRCIIYSDGDIENHDNSYGSLSDERIKQNITDANSQWDDIKALKIRNYKKKDDVRQYGDKAWEQIGVIAQELEAANMNKLIKHNDPSPADVASDSSFGTLYEDGDTIPEGKKIGDVKEVKEQVKGVKYSVLYMKAIKALQEAMAKIETLETKVKALEDA